MWMRDIEYASVTNIHKQQRQHNRKVTQLSDFMGDAAHNLNILIDICATGDGFTTNSDSFGHIQNVKNDTTTVLKTWQYDECEICEMRMARKNH